MTLSQVIEQSNLNELKEEQNPASGRIESPDSGINTRILACSLSFIVLLTRHACTLPWLKIS